MSRPATYPNRTPIVIDGLSGDGVREMKKFIADLKKSDTVSVAQQESKNLAPYFNALSLYLTGNMPAAAPSPVSPEALAQLFTTVAAYTRNTLTTGVAIIPDNLDQGPMWETAYAQENFFKDYTYGFNSFRFGFYKTYSTHKNGGLVSFPVLMLDHDMLAKAAPYEAEPMLRALQSVFTAVNHDLLHHLTAPMVHGPVDYALFNPSRHENAMAAWDEKLRTFGNNQYENWAQLTQQKILLAPGNEAVLQSIASGISTYMNELQRIGTGVMAAADGDAFSKKAAGHVVVDYFGTVMIHALTRIVPLDHPLMTECIARLEKIDPLPNEAFGDCCQLYQIPRRHIDRQEALDWLRELCTDDPDFHPIVLGYKKAGLNLLPKKEGDFSYRCCKLLQQVKLSVEDVTPHTPHSPDHDIRRLQNGTGKLARGMITAAKKMSAGYELK